VTVSRGSKYVYFALYWLSMVTLRIRHCLQLRGIFHNFPELVRGSTVSSVLP